MTRNKFTSFRPWKLETSTFLESNKMCILRTMILSLINKIYLYCYVIICIISLLALQILYFPCYVELSLDFKLECTSKKKNLKDHIVLDEQMEFILKHKCTFIRCSYHFNTPFCVTRVSSVKKRNFMSKRKTILSQAAWFFFFLYFMSDEHIF